VFESKTRSVLFGINPPQNPEPEHCGDISICNASPQSETSEPPNGAIPLRSSTGSNVALRDRIALRRLASYRSSERSGAHATVMFTAFNLSFGALLHHGGVGSVNRTSRRLWRPLLFAPTPLGTDTAGPADQR
jgi:hypothetical protein